MKQFIPFATMLCLTVVNIGYAQISTVKENAVLQAPNVHAHNTSGDAVQASWDGNIGIHVFHGKDDTVSGFRYAKGLANGFVNDQLTEGRPIYVTVTYEDTITSSPTFVKIFMNGYTWKFKGYNTFEPKAVWNLIPILTSEVVQKYGKGKIVKGTPVLVTSQTSKN